MPDSVDQQHGAVAEDDLAVASSLAVRRNGVRTKAVGDAVHDELTVLARTDRSVASGRPGDDRHGLVPANAPRPPTLTSWKRMILCCGNPARGDDGAGRRVAELLAPFQVPVFAIDGHATSILDAWQGCDWTILVDAVVTGAPPGTIHRWDTLPEALPSPGSTHGLGVREAIQLGRIAGNLPPKLTLLGIEAATFEHGAALSPPVEAALPRLVRLILSEFECLRSTGSTSTTAAPSKE